MHAQLPAEAATAQPSTSITLLGGRDEVCTSKPSWPALTQHSAKPPHAPSVLTCPHLSNRICFPDASHLVDFRSLITLSLPQPADRVGPHQKAQPAGDVAAQLNLAHALLPQCCKHFAYAANTV